MIKGLIAAATSLLITLFVAELAVRVLFPDWAPRTPRLAQFWQHDELYGWSHIPGAKGRFDTYGFDVSVEINEQGFRGPDVETEKDASKTRILVVGDSLVWGFGVQEEDTFIAEMAARCPNLEVINFGVSGYSTDQELLLFNERGKPLNPDIVVLVVASNDFSDNIRSTVNVYYQKPLYVLENRQLVLTNRPVPEPNPLVVLASSIARQSYLLTQLGRTIQGLTLARETKAAPKEDKPKPERTAAPFPRTEAERMTTLLIEAFLREVEASGARPAIVFNDARGYHITKLLGLDRMPVVQLEDLKLDPDPERYRLPGDFHWNAAGHKEVAERILNGLMETGTLERCGA